jgi:hypothetical protein
MDFMLQSPQARHLCLHGSWIHRMHLETFRLRLKAVKATAAARGRKVRDTPKPGHPFTKILEQATYSGPDPLQG